jgi:hypothetical protein
MLVVVVVWGMYQVALVGQVVEEMACLVEQVETELMVLVVEVEQVLQHLEMVVMVLLLYVTKPTALTEYLLHQRVEQ